MRISAAQDPLLFGLLGPIEAWRDGQPVALGTPRQRCVLAVLLLDPNRLLPVTRLVELLWAEEPPRTAHKNVQGYIHKLRAALAGLTGVAVRTRAPGYLLEVNADLVDLHRFRRLAAAAHRSGAPAAATLLTRALALWRGPALADAGTQHLCNVAVQLEEERLSALERLWEAELSLARHAECVTKLAVAVSEHPLRERLRGLLMLALVRCGRTADALAVYRAGQVLLDRELGIQPSPELQQMHQRILRNDWRVRSPVASDPP